jgi:predicted MPP superfamily phosphohydrolase
MSFLIDCLAICSIIGIWPRYIEPRLLKTTFLNWTLPTSAYHLDALKLLHMTDLHFHEKLPESFLEKIIRQVEILKPDLILFTGDFLCYSRLTNSPRLLSFLSHLKAPLGSFCTFGNHDYAQYVSLNTEGKYDLLTPPGALKGVFRGLKTLISSPITMQGIADKTLTISFHKELCSLLRRTSFQLIENSTINLPIGLNVTGLGDLALGRCKPEIAFANYNPSMPGIVLSHNPDTFPVLLNYPGDWVLSGHTHGEQIHIPWPSWGRHISKKLARLETGFTRGLFSFKNKKLYVNRGLGCHKPFRLFSPPELCLIQAIKGEKWS